MAAGCAEISISGSELRFPPDPHRTFTELTLVAAIKRTPDSTFGSLFDKIWEIFIPVSWSNRSKTQFFEPRKAARTWRDWRTLSGTTLEIPPQTSNLNSVLSETGALLVGTWANSLLVSSAIAIDAVSMIANYASVYLYTITHWEPVLGKSFWSHWKKHNRTHVIEQFDPLYLFATGVVAALAQSFLAARTRNKFITLTLFFIIMVATGGAFACGVTIAIFPEYTNRRKAIIPATTWLITEAVTDISIASALLWEFWKAKSSFKETRSLLNRLVAQTIQSGTAGASIALSVLVAFLTNKESNGGFVGLPLSSLSHISQSPPASPTA
ncbi:hypothetical protein B0H19DRAFT_1070347 [Mycena capillaripes]|nr:hypothetical protein B0H19DRAFT_1070347 [Mycena capillaripes]